LTVGIYLLLLRNCRGVSGYYATPELIGTADRLTFFQNTCLVSRPWFPTPAERP